jgi:plastocyanin
MSDRVSVRGSRESRPERERARKLELVLAAWCLSAAAGVGAGAAETHDVLISGESFQPPLLTIQVGDSVRFRNQSSMAHNVRADDNSFRCATGCDGGGPNPDPGYEPGEPPDSPGDPTGNWSFTRVFDAAASIRYYCEAHGGPGGAGMSGRIVVQSGAGGGSAGQTRFSADRFTVSENGGPASVTVERAGGSSGAVTVTVTTGGGTASAGSDFQSVSQAVSWTDGSSTVRTIQVPILDDLLREGTETVTLSLSGPTGGATLGAPTNAELRILDDEEPASGGGGSAGALRFESTRLWTFEDGAELAVRVLREGGKTGAVSASVSASGGVAIAGTDFAGGAGSLTWGNGDDTPRTLVLDPIDDGAGEGTEKVVLSLSSPSGGASLGSGASATVFLIERPASCTTTAQGLCLGNRFVAQIAFATAAGETGQGNAVQLTTDSGYFTFFDPTNVEAVVKVLNACGLNNHFWVFGAGLTDVEVDLSVVDTQAGTTVVYSSPLGTAFQPVTDVNAFATCP